MRLLLVRQSKCVYTIDSIVYTVYIENSITKTYLLNNVLNLCVEMIFKIIDQKDNNKNGIEQ